MLGDFARERKLLLFQSGNESENWMDPAINVVYKMNTLMHVGGDILRLLQRIDLYNQLFPEVAMRFVGFQLMSETNVYPVFAQQFISNARFATEKEIRDYMQSMSFLSTGNDGEFTNGKLLLKDVRPKNVLYSATGAIFVIDADVERI